jgi:hypothetical protein
MVGRETCDSALDAGSEEGALDAGGEGGAGDDSGLLAYWSFDQETNGFVPDLTGHGHHGQLGTPALLAPGMDGGQALASPMTVWSLMGQNFPPRGTLSFWLTADFTGSQVNGLAIFDNFDPSRSHLFVRVPNGQSSASLQMAYQNAGQQSYPFVTGLPNPSNNTWTHLVFAWDSVLYTAAVYVDGNLLPPGYGGGLTSWTPSGQQFVFSSMFPKGLVDEARVYSRALPASEVSTIP